MSVLYLDRTSGVLYHDGLGMYLPQERRWQPASARGESVTPRAAVTWLQRQSGTPCRGPVGVIGPRDANEAQLEFAERVGEGLARMGITVICGGRNGVMTAVAKGASAAQGVVVGLLPDADWRAANPYVTVPIATGLGIARNAVLARASIALVAVGGGYGTISEIALGLQFGVPVFGFFETSPVPGVRLVRDVDEALTRVAEAILALPGGD
ncbi:MAG: TIGR00725 family protein [Burkholderiales bacterium]